MSTGNNATSANDATTTNAVSERVAQFNAQLRAAREYDESELLNILFRKSYRSKNNLKIISACLSYLSSYIDITHEQENTVDLHFCPHDLIDLVRDAYAEDFYDELPTESENEDVEEVAAYWAKRLLLYEVILKMIRDVFKDYEDYDTFCIPSFLGLIRDKHDGAEHDGAKLPEE